MFKWLKSTRSILAVLAMILIFVVVVLSAFGKLIPGEVLSIVSLVVGSVITAYFGKRDNKE